MKSWKHWPYWLRGGVIGGGVALSFAFISPFFCVPLGFICLILSVPTLPLFPFVEVLALNSDNLLRVIVPAITATVWFIAGSVTGSLVSYIHSKKKLS